MVRLPERPAPRLIALGLALAAAAIIALLAVVMNQGGERASAHFPPDATSPGSHPALDFNIGANTDGNVNNGDQRPDGQGVNSPRGDDCVSFSKLLITATPAAPAICHIVSGGTFGVRVYLNSLDSVPNYGGFDIKLQYTGVTYNVGSFDKMGSWPSCGFQAEATATQPATPPAVLAGCTVGVGTPDSAYTGRIATATFDCVADGSITLVHGSGSTDVAQNVTGTPPVENHGEVDGTSETLTILCDATPTPSPSPTITPTPTPFPEISLNAGGANVVCDPSTPAAKPQRCTAHVEATPANGAFDIIVDANAIPNGYGGFNSELFFGGLELISRSCLDEVTWPDRFLCQQVVPTPVAPAPTSSKQHRARSAIFPPYPTSTYLGDLVHVRVDCPRPGQFKVVLPAYFPTATGTPQPSNPVGRPQAAAYFNANETPIGVATIAADSLDTNGDGVPDTTPLYPIADALIINCEEAPTITPTPSATAPAGATPTATATPCPTVCPTATPTNTATVTNTPGAPTVTPTHAPTGESVTRELTVPGKVTTDTEGDGATGTDQVETSVTTTGPGSVTITEKSIVQPDPAGYTFFGQQVNISAPPATSVRPITLIFWLDTSIIPPGASAGQIQVFKDGALLPVCSGPPNTASPNPCIEGRTFLTGTQAGDLKITVLSSVAATSWNFGVSSTAGVVGDANCDGVVNAIDAAIILQKEAGIISAVPCPENADVNGDGQINSVDASLILQYSAGLITTFPAGAGVSAWSGFAGLAARIERLI